MFVGLLILPFLIFIMGKTGGLLILSLELILIWILTKSYSEEIVSPQKLLNLITLTCVSILICFPWYGHNLINISIGMTKFAFPAEILKGDMDWNLPIWGFYIEIIERQMGLPLFLIFIFAFISILCKRERFSAVLIVWIMLPTILFTFINNKGARYTLPCLPAMALVSSIYLTKFKHCHLRKILYFATIIFGVTSSLFAGFSNKNVPIPIMGGKFFGYNNPPISQAWPIQKILEDIVSEVKPAPGKTITARTLTNYKYFQRGGFRDASEIQGLPIVVKSVKRNIGEMTDFFITKTGNYGLHRFRDINPKITRLISDPALQNTFQEFKSYPLPDGSKGLIFKKNVQPAFDLPDIENLHVIGELILNSFENYPIYGIKNAINAEVIIVPTENPDDIFLGRYKQVTIKADSAISNKIKIDDFGLRFEDVQINIYDLILNNKFILFELRKLTPKGTLNFDSLERDAQKLMKQKGEVKVEGFDSGLLIKARYNLPQGQTVEGSAKVTIKFIPGKMISPLMAIIFQFVRDKKGQLNRLVCIEPWITVGSVPVR